MPKPPAALADAVFRTVAWFAVLGVPPTAAEVHRFLFGARATLTDVKKELRKSRRLGSSSGFYFLKKRPLDALTRCRQHFTALKLWRRVLAGSWLLRSTPFLRFVAVGNTLAFGWPEADSDIDLFVVARSGRLFLARAWLTLLAQLAGRRRHGSKIAGRLCLSFFVDESAQNLALLRIAPADPYLAFWVASLVPLAGDSAAFAAANRWAARELPNAPPPRVPELRPNFFARLAAKLLGGKFGDWLEARLQKWQLGRIAKKERVRAEPTAVVTTATVLKFHETDRRRELLAAWQKLTK